MRLMFLSALRSSHPLFNRWQHIFRIALTRPFQLFATESIVQILGIYMAFVYGVFYRASCTWLDRRYIHHFHYLVFLTTIPTIFSSIYHERTGISSLHYIALGIGLSLACQVNGYFMDRIYIHFKNKNGGVGEPEFRLREWVPLISPFPSTYIGEVSVDDPRVDSPPSWAAACWVVGRAWVALDCYGYRKPFLYI